MPTKPEFSILLKASIDAKVWGLTKRTKENGFVSEIDKNI